VAYVNTVGNAVALHRLCWKTTTLSYTKPCGARHHQMAGSGRRQGGRHAVGGMGMRVGDRCRGGGSEGRRRRRAGSGGQA